ncbi:MAG TPA: SHOCT domain-containing protein [Acidimicrobiia bacterium]
MKEGTLVPLLDLFWAMLWFFLFFMWIWLLISLFTDVFRSDDLSGWGKSGWIFFMIIIPWLGALVYVIVRGKSMQDRAIAEMARQEKASRAYIQDVASSASTADELAKMAALRDSGVLTDQEFAAQKNALLS